MTTEICAFCRHWKIGTTDSDARMNAYAREDEYECHVKQPNKTIAYQTCNYFERAITSMRYSNE